MKNYIRGEIRSFEVICNWLELVGVLIVLTTAFIFQFLLHELPCPLCLLQRFGFFGIALGLLMNLQFGLRPSHYSIVLLSALYTSFVALRQVALHVLPGSGSYGTTFLGLHFYTWSFIVSVLIIIATSIMLGFDRQYYKHIKTGYFRILVNFSFLFYVLLLVANIASVFMICGLKACPDNPVHYIYL